MKIEDQILFEIKPYIAAGDLGGLQELWNRYQHEIEWEHPIAWDYIFQKSYLHAALKKQREICTWLDTLFLSFDPMIQIAMRQMFAYARYLLAK
jgi:hypothetical protein